MTSLVHFTGLSWPYCSYVDNLHLPCTLAVISSAVAISASLAVLVAFIFYHSDNMPATPKEIVENAIATHPVVVFSKTYCPYCKKAKAALKEAGAKVDGYPGAFVIELDIREDGPAIQAYLAQKTGRTSVPNVFIGGKTVGGGDDTVALAKSGVLPQMIAAALHHGSDSDTKVKAAGDDSGNWALFGAGM